MFNLRINWNALDPSTSCFTSSPSLIQNPIQLLLHFLVFANIFSNSFERKKGIFKKTFQIAMLCILSRHTARANRSLSMFNTSWSDKYFIYFLLLFICTTMWWGEKRVELLFSCCRFSSAILYRCRLRHHVHCASTMIIVLVLLFFTINNEGNALFFQVHWVMSNKNEISVTLNKQGWILNQWKIEICIPF